MRRLTYSIDLNHFKRIKNEIVPILFTEHQFKLIERKFSGKRFTDSEKNEFSRAVSRKMKALSAILNKDNNNMFFYGKEKILTKRLSLAIKYLKKYSRKFKNKHVLLGGSFLYSEIYNDIDIFVISKYEKEDYREEEFHISYLSMDVYASIFFQSLKQICISNKPLVNMPIEEKEGLDTFISIYQELCNDLSNNPHAVRSTLRNFLIQAAYISKQSVPDSFEIKKQIDSIFKLKNPLKLIKSVFVNAVVLGENKKKLIPVMKTMINSYNEVMKEYKQHRQHYLDVVSAFKEVISIES